MGEGGREASIAEARWEMKSIDTKDHNNRIGGKHV